MDHSPTLEDALVARGPSFARRLIPWLVVVAILGTGTAGFARWASVERPVAIDVVELHEGEVERTVASVSAGRIAARRRARISAQVSGRITNLCVKRGDRVVEGQLVIELDPREAEAGLDASQCAVVATKAAIAEANARLELARGEADRRKRTAPGVIAPEQLERALKEAAALEAQVAALEARLKEGEAHVRTQRALLDKHQIRAPFAGVVSELWVERGEITTTMPVASRGTEGGSRLFEVIDTSELYVTAPIDEADLARVTSGLAARVTLDPWPREPFMGVVTRVAPYVLDVEEQNRTVEVEVSIPSTLAGRELKPGTSADVEVIVERKDRAARLPTHLVIDGKRVLSVEPGPAPGELRVVERPVQIGVENWRYTEVLGLPAGTRVVAAAEGDVRVKPGQLVTIRKVVPSEANDR